MTFLRFQLLLPNISGKLDAIRSFTPLKKKVTYSSTARLEILENNTPFKSLMVICLAKTPRYKMVACPSNTASLKISKFALENQKL